MSDARRRYGPKLVGWTLVVWWLLAGAAAQALTEDLTTQFAITRSGLVLNRTTNTFDSTVTLKNASGAPVLAPIDVAVAGLPAGVTLANKTGDKADGRPYVSPMAPGSMLANGSTLSFALKFANPARVSFNSTLQIIRTVVEAPANAPSLLGVVATGGASARLVGRVEGAPNQDVSLQLSSASICVAGTLVSGVTGATVIARTDSAGYFGVNVAGVNPGDFVALKTVSGNALSLCQVSSRDNDSWPKAFPLDTTNLTASDFIDSPGKARWYKVAITPGQRIQVVLSNLPADYDLAVFKDIAQAFANQFNPATAGVNDLLKLAAEYAPSTFSPSTFSPSTFSPDAYTPSTFSPSTFSPSLFSPSTFSPSTFSPSTFSPSTFSPSTFSPSTFSPSTFSPSTFSPSIYTETEIQQAFSTAQTKSVISVAVTPGTGSESTVVNTWNNTGNFYIRVVGRNGAFSTTTPFTISVAKGPTTCTGVTDITLSPRSQLAATGLKTVIVTDSSRVALDDELLVPGGGTLRAKLAAFASRAEVKGVVVDIANDSRVTTLKTQAANNPACPFAKNLVAEEIKSIVDRYRANPLQYVVLVGNDNAIPFFRTPDQTPLGLESQYVPPVESNSPSEASLRRDFVLSQDAYGSKTKLTLPATDFQVPGLAVGRLIETTTEIAGIIDAYVAANGVVAPSTSLVTGYDFLEDAANAVGRQLACGTGASADQSICGPGAAATGAVLDTLITPNGKSPQDPLSWNAAQLGTKLLGSRHDVIFLAGHFSANSALAADFKTNLLTTDLAAAPVDLTNSIVFSAGCHSGYNLVDTDAIAGVTMPLDWAQAFARKKATLVAGTGYQYGDTDFLEYSERLYNNFARRLRGGNGAVAIGEALVQAKLDYLATTSDIRGIHEKALLEATLFGLPMLGVNMPSGRGAGNGNAGVITPVAVAAGSPAATLGLRTFDFPLAPTLAPRTIILKNVEGGPDVIATWLDGPDGVVTKPSEPALPLAAVNVTPTDPNVVLRGVGFRGGNFTDSTPIIPFSGAPTTELRGVHGPFNSPVFFPARLWTPNYFGALSGGGGTQLLVTPAQHRAVDFVAGTSTQRKFTNLNMRLYYSSDRSKAALSNAPQVVGVEALRVLSDVQFTVQVIGDPAAAIHQVWITYNPEGSGTWTPLDLAQCVRPTPADPLPPACGATDDSRVWKGRLAGAPSNLKYVVQAASGIGLVALDDNLGSYYGVGAVVPVATTLALVSPPAGATIGATVNVKAMLAYGGVALANKPVLIGIGGVAHAGVTGNDGSATIGVPVAVDAGSYLISASFAGDDLYLPSSVTSAFQITKAPTTLSPLSPTGVTLTGVVDNVTQVLQRRAVKFTVTGPGGATTFWADTNHLGQAVPPTGLPGGDYSVLTAAYDGDAMFAATSLSFAPAQQFTVQKIPQTIALDPLADRTIGSPVVSLYATASSGLPVTYGVSGACALQNNLVTLGGIGSCTVTANQSGDAVYAAASQQQRTFNITPANQAITFGPAPTGVTAQQLLVTLTASSSSPTAAPSTIPLVFTSLTPSVCTWGGIGGSSVTFVAPGTCTIAANQAGNAFYNAAPQATLDIPVAAALPAPTTFIVSNNNDNGPGSLRDAITQANNTPGVNAISFVGVTGTIFLTSGQINISGPLLITGPGADRLTINGNANSRIFSIFATDPPCPAIDGPDYLVSISGLWLANARRNVAGSAGGAIFTEHSLALDSVVIENSVAISGGGVFVQLQYPGQSLTISNSRFLDNAAKELQPVTVLAQNGVHGGAIALGERCANATDTPHTTPVTVTISGSEFRGNAAQPTGIHGRGGAIRSYSRADITITDSVITENSVEAPNPPVAGKTYHGGAIDGSARSLRIERSEISDNAAFDVTGADVTRSGGLHLYNDAVDLQGPGDTMAVKIVNSTISNNFSSATAGAMVGFANVALELDHSTVADNQAPPTRTGGLIMNAGATYPVSNNTTARPSLTIVSSILANNSSSGGDLVTSSTGLPTLTVNAANSLIERVCLAGGGCGSTLVTGPGNLLSVDPILAPLAFNGGTSRTHALLPGSPAINTGSNPFGLATDQRGAGFPRVVGGATDMGAYESGTPVPLTNFAYSSQFGTVGNGDGQFSVPVGVAIDPSTRNIVVVDSSNHRVQIFNSAGSFLGKFGSVGSLNGQFSSPYMAAIDPTSHNIAVTDLGNNRVQIFNAAGVYQSQFGSLGTGNGQFQNPVGIVIDQDFHGIGVVDHTNNRVQIINSFTHAYESQLGSFGSGDGQLNAPDGVAFDQAHSNIVVADTGNNRVQIFEGDGAYLSQFGTQGNGPGQFNQPSGVAIDPTSHNIVVADYGNDRVQIFNSAGVFLSQFGGTGAGNGQFNRPYGVAIDPVSHNIVVVDQNNNRVQIFAPQ